MYIYIYKDIYKKIYAPYIVIVPPPWITLGGGSRRVQIYTVEMATLGGRFTPPAGVPWGRKGGNLSPRRQYPQSPFRERATLLSVGSPLGVKNRVLILCFILGGI